MTKAPVIVVKAVARKVKSAEKTYRVTYFSVGAGNADRLKITEGDHYVIAVIRKADWYDLLDLDEKGSVWQMLPDDIKRKVEWLRKAEKDGIELPSGPS